MRKLFAPVAQLDDVQDDIHGCISLAVDRMLVAMYKCRDRQEPGATRVRQCEALQRKMKSFD